MAPIIFLLDTFFCVCMSGSKYCDIYYVISKVKNTPLILNLQVDQLKLWLLVGLAVRIFITMSLMFCAFNDRQKWQVLKVGGWGKGWFKSGQMWVDLFQFKTFLSSKLGKSSSNYLQKLVTLSKMQWNLPGAFCFFNISLARIIVQFDHFSLKSPREWNDHGSRVIFVHVLLDFR